ncbi:MAG: class I SAM-dependent methyltransferase [Anaerolineae bacterium]|nr:class I SAM-dependent methyltransferase [Anaerolineae bacterium]
MPDLNRIYQEQPERYAELVAHEDYERNLLPAINAIVPVAGLDIVESGAGTGRITAQLAPLARNLFAFDLSTPMLKTASTTLRLGRFAAADHRALPLPNACADLIISGWSVCMLVVNYHETWQAQVTQTLHEFRRVLRPGGTIILIENQGTGAEKPQGHPNLDPYYAFLESRGFTSTWTRTDLKFASEAQAHALIGFFFGEEMAANLVAQYGIMVPECTGLWWKQEAGSKNHES